MQEVVCQECGRKIEVNLYYLEDGLAAGEFVKGQKMVKFKNFTGDMLDQFIDGVFDICKDCQRKLPPLTANDPTVLQSRRIMQGFNLLREMRPDLTDEQRRAEAIRAEFDPWREPNLAFRRFLVDRGERNEETDQAAKHALEAIS